MDKLIIFVLNIILVRDKADSGRCAAAVAVAGSAGQADSGMGATTSAGEANGREAATAAVVHVVVAGVVVHRGGLDDDGRWGVVRIRGRAAGDAHTNRGGRVVNGRVGHSASDASSDRGDDNDEDNDSNNDASNDLSGQRGPARRAGVAHIVRALGAVVAAVGARWAGTALESVPASSINAQSQ